MNAPQTLPRPALLDTELDAAALLIARLRSLFEHAVKGVAQACAKDGVLHAERLDAWQVASFDLAWSLAELDAARALLEAPSGRDTELEARLALIAACDAVSAVLVRLETIYLDLGLDPVDLHALSISREWAQVRYASVGKDALDAAGRAVLAYQDDIGRLHLTDDMELAQDTARRFASEVVAPLAASIHRDDLTVPETLLEPLRQMGVFGLAIPQSYGGSAPDDHDDTAMMMVVTEALSEASLGAAGSLITRPEILSRALLAGGTDLQKRDWLPRIAQGRPLCAISITEPDTGSDVASLTLRATPCEGGWRLDGAKTWCTFAGKAGVLLVVVRTDPDRSLGHRGLSLMLVEKPEDEGHSFVHRQPGGGSLTGRAIATIGYRGMHSYDLAFEDFFVPDDHVVGGSNGLGRGFYFIMAGMVGGRMQTAARAAGVMRAALLAALRYTRDRKVFEAPLCDFALTRAKLARMAARYSASRHLAYAVAREVDAGTGRMRASLVKLYACRSAELITREALQIHGGMGYAEETPVSRYFVDARVLSIFEGAEETLALKVIARTLFDEALQAQSINGEHS